MLDSVQYDMRNISQVESSIEELDHKIAYYQRFILNEDDDDGTSQIIIPNSREKSNIFECFSLSIIFSYFFENTV